MAASLEMSTSKATPGSRNLLNQWFPHTVNPVIASAPMLGIANATLAAQVSKAGGLGVVPGGYLFTPDSPHLVTLAKELKLAREVLGLTEEPSSALPVAVGFLLFDPSVAQFASTTVPLLKQHRVQAVWLFAENVEKYGSIKTIIESLHEAGILAICQVGNVAASRLAVQEGADVIVAQGSDAGGHQFIQNSGLISLVPEVRQMLDTEFPDRQVALMAAGGIAEGRGVAAALALGADGIVMGTRFIIAKEAEAQEYFKTAVIEAVDGGVSTSKSVFHDDLANMNIWPKPYDGRAIISKSYLDHIAGMPLDENQARYAEAQKSGDVARLSVWAGTGVGLVNEVLPAAEIVEKTRAEAKRTAQALQSLL